ncbi:hypothetical protein KE3_1847 [Streptococcus lutetiensis 033]|uniref:Uncharacterized protein n=2 Tax=Streptococcus TaxID=1301 RepID=A0AB33ANY2_9STRE|nr:hypothetical protein KE3_1847 [Streptococcus lutetiensis 033]BAK30846.1 putative extracellular protein [Streptococcus pasteurianus ATCC 43144]
MIYQSGNFYGKIQKYAFKNKTAICDKKNVDILDFLGDKI